MHSKALKIQPYEKEWQEIQLSEEIIATYSLKEWAAHFSLMTAGYRDQLNPNDADDPMVAFNSLTVAIFGEAKARVFERKLIGGEVAHVHVGGETRPHTQDFIAILSRIYAAHNMTVHLRANIKTTPIWYSSFGIFYKSYQSGDNLTASHSPFFKGGWKPMDASGKQLLTEEKEIVAEVQQIISHKETIRLAPWEFQEKAGRMSAADIHQAIAYDFDLDEAYVKYQKSVLTDKSIAEIHQAIANGFRCSACTVGGSMKATTERLFPMLGISVGPKGAVQYFFGEEDSQYHQLGQKDGRHFGPDPSREEVFKGIGAQKILLHGEASAVLIWDPDGDRFNIITTTDRSQADRAKQLGLDVELDPSCADKAIVYFTANQLFFMLTANRINSLREAKLLHAYDWFIASSISSSHSIGEIAALEKIPVANVRVGFKYMGTLSSWLENRVDPKEPFINAIGDKIHIGDKPRALIMCEESGGALFGGTELLMNEKGSRGLIGIRDKDGMQFALMTLSLVTRLYNLRQSLAEYYCDLIEKHHIKYRFFDRRDVTLYNERLTGIERKQAKSDGEKIRDKTMEFFKHTALQAASGKSLDEIQNEINLRLGNADKKIPRPKRISLVGEGKLLEGTFLEFDDFWFLIRASGTDALLRYYIEGKDKDEIKAYQQSFIHLNLI